MEKKATRGKTSPRPLISVVVNTLNEEKNIGRCLKSVQHFADEIVLVDMHSDDRTREIAAEFGARIFLYSRVGYVEPARNFAISKARGRWVLILDADERIGRTLARRLSRIAAKPHQDIDYVLIPRKNIIFGKWIQNSRWWPDYLPRFFKKGKVKWPKQIHQKPILRGKIYTLPDNERFAIIHDNYRTLDQFLERSRRYAEVQANELIKEKKYILNYDDLLLKPLGEFLSRFFAGEGYRDGLHGLALSLLQAYAVALVYLKVWEKQRYRPRDVEEKRIKRIFRRFLAETAYWFQRWRFGQFSGWRKFFSRFWLRGFLTWIKL